MAESAKRTRTTSVGVAGAKTITARDRATVTAAQLVSGDLYSSLHCLISPPPPPLSWSPSPCQRFDDHVAAWRGAKLACEVLTQIRAPCRIWWVRKRKPRVGGGGWGKLRNQMCVAMLAFCINMKLVQAYYRIYTFVNAIFDQSIVRSTVSSWIRVRNHTRTHASMCSRTVA